MARMEAGAHRIPDIPERGEEIDVIVIGAGQAGLAVAACLARHGLRSKVLEALPRVGDIWRSRWDSLRLFTPARYDGLPGMPFPASPGDFPTRDQVADYLEAYAGRMQIPVETGVRVDGVWPAGDGQDGYVVTAKDRRFAARQVVVATGAHERPRIPAFAPRLDPAILHMHSSAYRHPGQLRPGDVLVVGAGNSGAEIALEAARAHRTILAGRHPGQEPVRPESRLAPLFDRGIWFLAHRVLTLDTPLGRKVAPSIRAGHAAPVARARKQDLRAAGVERTFARVVGVREGIPLLDDGHVADVANVVWCTGFRNDFSWIHLPVTGEDGYPIHERGVALHAEGLYFVGLPFLYSLSSMLIGGVGRDAEYVAERILAHSRSV